jgi:hypothetical protein
VEDDMVTEVFGFLAVASMVIMYALEPRSPLYILGFAASCAAASLYAALIHSWPFAAVEGVWAVVAVLRWVRVRRRAAPRTLA